MKNGMIKGMIAASILGGMTIAGYMYMKKNPEVMKDMKKMMEDATKETCECLKKEI